MEGLKVRFLLGILTLGFAVCGPGVPAALGDMDLDAVRAKIKSDPSFTPEVRTVALEVLTDVLLGGLKAEQALERDALQIRQEVQLAVQHGEAGVAVASAVSSGASAVATSTLAPVATAETFATAPVVERFTMPVIERLVIERPVIERPEPPARSEILAAISSGGISPPAAATALPTYVATATAPTTTTPPPSPGVAPSVPTPP